MNVWSYGWGSYCHLVETEARLMKRIDWRAKKNMEGIETVELYHLWKNR